MSGDAHAGDFGTTTAPCPDWCDRPAGHGYEVGDSECETRVHARDFGDVLAGGSVVASVSASALEDLVLDVDGTTVQHHVPTISVDTGGEEMTGPQARALAAMLLAAAHLWDEVTGRVKADD